MIKAHAVSVYTHDKDVLTESLRAPGFTLLMGETGGGGEEGADHGGGQADAFAEVRELPRPAAAWEADVSRPVTHVTVAFPATVGSRRRYGC